MEFIKKYFWYIVGAVVGIVALVFVRDVNTLKMIESFFRRKNVEAEVDKLKESLAKSDVKLAANDEELVVLAEKLKKDKVSAKTATDEEIKGFYNELFKSN